MGATKIFIKQAVVCIDDIDETDASCPTCKSNRAMILDGYVMIPKTIMVEGEDISTEYSKDKGNTYKLSTLLCLICNTKHFVQDRDLFELQKTNIKMNEIIREKTGRDLLDLGPIC